MTLEALAAFSFFAYAVLIWWITESISSRYCRSWSFGLPLGNLCAAFFKWIAYWLATISRQQGWQKTIVSSSSLAFRRPVSSSLFIMTQSSMTLGFERMPPQWSNLRDGGINAKFRMCMLMLWSLLKEATQKSLVISLLAWSSQRVSMPGIYITVSLSSSFILVIVTEGGCCIEHCWLIAVVSSSSISMKVNWDASNFMI